MAKSDAQLAAARAEGRQSVMREMEGRLSLISSLPPTEGRDASAALCRRVKAATGDNEIVLTREDLGDLYLKLAIWKQGTAQAAASLTGPELRFMRFREDEIIALDAFLQKHNLTRYRQ